MVQVNPRKVGEMTTGKFDDTPVAAPKVARGGKPHIPLASLMPSTLARVSAVVARAVHCLDVGRRVGATVSALDDVMRGVSPREPTVLADASVAAQDIGS